MSIHQVKVRAVLSKMKRKMGVGKRGVREVMMIVLRMKREVGQRKNLRLLGNIIHLRNILHLILKMSDKKEVGKMRRERVRQDGVKRTLQMINLLVCVFRWYYVWMFYSFPVILFIWLYCVDYGGGSSIKEKEIVRKEMGLEWMLRPAERTDRRPAVTVNSEPDEPPAVEVCHFQRCINFTCL